MSAPEPEAATPPLWRAAQAFRAATLLYAVGVQVSSDHLYEHPTLSWVLVAAQLVWSVGVGLVYLLGSVRWLPLVEVAVTIGFACSSWLVAGPSVWAHHQSLPTTLWLANAVVSVAISRGARWGTAAGLLIGVAVTVVSRDPTNLWRDAALPVFGAVGLGIGVGASAARRAQAQLARAVRLEAATRERERLARDVHDGVLQVLALMRRQGADEPGRLGELSRLAGEQEASLRTLLAGPTVAPAGASDQVDLREALQGHAPAGVPVSAPAEPVEVPADVAEALAGAAGAAIANARQHAGDTARLFLLVEDLGSRVLVTVRDDGVGMDPGRLQRAEQEGRMGVSRSIVGRMTEVGGEAQVWTAPGEGVEWELRAPRPPQRDRSEG